MAELEPAGKPTGETSGRDIPGVVGAIELESDSSASAWERAPIASQPEGGRTGSRDRSGSSKSSGGDPVSALDVPIEYIGLRLHNTIGTFI